MPFLRSFVLLAAGLSAATAAEAAPFAFVSVSSPVAGRAVRVVDLATMTVETSIGGVGDEPGRMVSNADRTRIYVSSWTDATPDNRGEIYAIDTRTRRVVGSAVVGLVQNRTVAISPDDLRVYTFKVELVGGVGALSVAVLDATTLAGIASVPINGQGCLQNTRQVYAMPDGRIVVNACSDGLRVIDPVTFAVATRGSTPNTSERLLGHSPDGSEVYLGTGSTSLGVFGTTGVRALNVDTGASVDLTWNVPPAGSYPGFGSGTSPSRLTVVPVAGGTPDEAIYLFSYFSAGFSNTPIAWARAASLSNGARQLTGLAAVGGTAVVGVDVGGLVGLSGRLDSARRVLIDPASSSATIASSGDFVSMPGLGTLADIIVVPYAPDPLFNDDFESDAP
jgi:hypothetical protein